MICSTCLDLYLHLFHFLIHSLLIWPLFQIDVNMTAVNNLNEPSSTGVVNNPTSPLVDCDANTVMVFFLWILRILRTQTCLTILFLCCYFQIRLSTGSIFSHDDQFINQEVPVHAADDDPLVPPYRKKQASKGYSESASGRVPVW